MVGPHIDWSPWLASWCPCWTRSSNLTRTIAATLKLRTVIPLVTLRILVPKLFISDVVIDFLNNSFPTPQALTSQPYVRLRKNMAMSSGFRMLYISVSLRCVKLFEALPTWCASESIEDAAWYWPRSPFRWWCSFYVRWAERIRHRIVPQSTFLWRYGCVLWVRWTCPFQRNFEATVNSSSILKLERDF